MAALPDSDSPGQGDDTPPKVAVVTGAGKGLGRAVAVGLAKRGYDLAICARTTENLQPRNFPGASVLAIPIDVSVEEECRAFAQSVIETYGHVDVLVNNAGYVHPRGTLDALPPWELEMCLAVNLRAPFHFMQAFIPFMRTQKRGVIVNVASKAARYAVPGVAAYNASKAALVSLTQTAAKENRDKGLRIISISPGGMNTQMRKKVYPEENVNMLQTPEDVANVVLDIVDDHEVDTKYDGLQHVLNGDDVLVWGHPEIFRMEDRY